MPANHEVALLLSPCCEPEGIDGIFPPSPPAQRNYPNESAPIPRRRQGCGAEFIASFVFAFINLHFGYLIYTAYLMSIIVLF